MTRMHTIFISSMFYIQQIIPLLALVSELLYMYVRHGSRGSSNTILTLVSDQSSLPFLCTVLVYTVRTFKTTSISSAPPSFPLMLSSSSPLGLLLLLPSIGGRQADWRWREGGRKRMFSSHYCNCRYHRSCFPEKIFRHRRNTVHSPQQRGALAVRTSSLVVGGNWAMAIK